MSNLFAYPEDSREHEILSDWINGNRKDAMQKYLRLPEWQKPLVVAELAPEEVEAFSILLRN